MSSDKTPRKDRNAGYTLTPEFHRTPLGANQKINNCQQRNESRSKFPVDIPSEDVALNTPTTSNLQTAQAVCEETAINATILRQNVGKSCVVQTPVDSTLQSEHFQSSQYCHEVIVEVRVVFLKIGEIDTLKEYYQADAFLQAKWREPKLDGKNQEYLGRTDLDLYWNPLCYVDNILSETKEVRWLSTQTKPNGEVYIVDRRRVRGVFLETLELNDFPLDVQDLTITVTSERPDTEVDLIPDNSEMSAINNQTFVDQQEWKLHEHVEITKRVITQEYSRSMQSHSCISVTCRAARRPGYFYWNVFLIMFMISGLAFATFAVSLDKAELRLRLSFTLILTSVTFKYVITQNLPRISYLTYTDKYVLMSLAILCIISVWHAVITILTISAPAVSNTTVSQSFANASHLLRHSDKDGVLPGVSAKPPENQATYGEQKFDSNFPSGNQNSPLAEDSILKPRSKTYLGGSQKLDSSSSGSTRGVELGDFTVTDEMVSVYFLRLLKAYMDAQDQLEFSPEFVDTKQRGRLEVMKRLEQDVFISFVILYVIAHSVFGFWLYFDTAPAIFQQTMDALLTAIEGAAAYLDDIIVPCSNPDELLIRQETVLCRTQDYGFRLRLDKCYLFMPSVEYLGFKIDRGGRRPDPANIDTIKQMPPQKDVIS
nr:unnamed protein product [Spirometra erinaceieuropaei]